MYKHMIVWEGLIGVLVDVTLLGYVCDDWSASALMCGCVPKCLRGCVVGLWAPRVPGYAGSPRPSPAPYWLPTQFPSPSNGGLYSSQWPGRQRCLCEGRAVLGGGGSPDLLRAEPCSGLRPTVGLPLPAHPCPWTELSPHPLHPRLPVGLARAGAGRHTCCSTLPPTHQGASRGLSWWGVKTRWSEDRVHHLVGFGSVDWPDPEHIQVKSNSSRAG